MRPGSRSLYFYDAEAAAGKGREVPAVAQVRNVNACFRAASRTLVPSCTVTGGRQLIELPATGLLHSSSLPLKESEWHQITLAVTDPALNAEGLVEGMRLFALP